MNTYVFKDIPSIGQIGIHYRICFLGSAYSTPRIPIDAPCECEHNNPDSLDARLFPSVVLAVTPAVTMDEASSLFKHHDSRCFVDGHSRRDSYHHEGEQSRISGIRVVVLTFTRGIDRMPEAGVLPTYLYLMFSISYTFVKTCVWCVRVYSQACVAYWLKVCCAALCL